ncbi:MAG: beta-lactamase family protein [Candidatus Rokubacteria bacterium]|nr:beta-lactamase family protein [Candidatus Rokubacteria bacterium]
MRMKAAIVALLLALATPVFAAEPLPTAKPESVGMSSPRLERIGQTLRADIEKGRMPGAVVAIARKGKLVYYEAFGFLDKAAGTPMPKDAIFAIASMTKPLAGVATMLLVEEGKIFVGEPAATYVPALGKMPVAVLSADGRTITETVPAKRPMTVQDLMRHTSGLTYGGRGDTAVHKLYPASSTVASRTYTAAEFMEKLVTLPLLYQPGTVWEYGLSTDVLGVVVETVSKQPLGQFLAARVFKPLGMVDTGFVIPAAKAARYARALPNDPETGRPQSVPDFTTPLKFECGGGCAVSTAADYVRFAQMLLNAGRFNGTQLLGRKSVALMTADHLTPDIQNNVAKVDASRTGYGFGLTMAVRQAPGAAGLLGSAGDFSWGGANGTNFWVDPKEQLVVVFMAHTPGATRVHYRKVMNALVLQAITD